MPSAMANAIAHRSYEVRPHPGVIAWFAELADEEIFLSVLAIGDYIAARRLCA